MLLSIASLLRKTAADMTQAGNAITSLTTKLIRENKMDKARTPEEKKTMCAILGQALIEEVKKFEGQGVSAEAAKEFIDTAKGLIHDNNLIKLMEFPYNWALAWKYKVKSAKASEASMKTSFNVLGSMGRDALKLMDSGVAPDELLEKLFKLSDECISDMQDLMQAWRKENKDDSKEIFGY